MSQNAEIDEKVELTKEQEHYIQNAVPDKNDAIVVACAGSGKTLGLSRAIASIYESGKDQKIIQAITFTKRAAKSIYTQINRSCPKAYEAKAADRIIQSSTFHSFCRKWMKYCRPWLFESIVYHVDEYLNWLLEWLTKQDNFECKLKGFDVETQKIKMQFTPEKWANMFSHLFVDEFQDVDELQYDIVLAMKKLNPSLKVTVIGDDAQTIYAWRGSRTDTMKRFSKDYHPISIYKFSVNHRSHARIVQLANEILQTFQAPILSPQQTPSNSPAKHYKPSRAVVVDVFDSVYSAIDTIASQLEYYMNKQKEWLKIDEKDRPKKVPRKLGDICVLARGTFILYNLQAALLQKNIPCQLYSGNEDWYQTGEDENTDDDLKQLFAERTFVTLSTIHSAKGLEWPHVISIGMENGYFPDKQSDMEEERRLAYVLVTRAMNTLTIYTTRGKKCDLLRKTFVQDILNQLQDSDEEDTDMEQDEKREKRKPKKDKGVLNAVKSLRNTDFLHIKRKIWPSDLEERITVMEGVGGIDTQGYPDWVVEKQLHGEYGSFIECLMHRMLAEYYHADTVVDKQINACIAKNSTRHLNPDQRIKWKKYAERYRDRQKVPTWNCPKIIFASWYMSMSGAILNGRRSALFKKVSRSKLTDPTSLKRYERIEKNLHKLIANCKKCTDSLSVSYQYEKLGLKLNGEIDLVVMIDAKTAILVDLKNSFYDCKKLRAGHLLQLWLYASMIRIEKQMTVETLLIWNQLGNVSFAVSLKDWNRDKEMLDFVVEKSFNVENENEIL